MGGALFSQLVHPCRRAWGVDPESDFGVPMKRKSHKRRKRNESARHETHAVHPKRRGAVNQEKIESTSKPWLRMIPAAEDDSITNGSRSFPLRNGRRHPPDLDLYIPEDNSRRR
jgi:hypothetical protein